MQRTKILAGTGAIILFLMGIVGTAGASGAAYCNISNTTIAAMCANLTSVQSSIALLTSNQVGTANITSMITANQINDEAYINTLSNSVSTLSANEASLSSELNNNATTISGLSSAIASINSNATNAKNVASIANVTANKAEVSALYATNQSKSTIDTLDNVNSSIIQKTQTLNTNLSTTARVLGPIANLNLTGTYSTTKSTASGADVKSDIAIILVVILIIIEIVRLIMGRNKKAKAIDSLPPIMQAESKAKANVSSQRKTSAVELQALQKQKDDSEMQAKINGLKSDPTYPALQKKLEQDKIKAKKMDIDISAFPSYKAMQALSNKYDISIETGNTNGK